MTQLLQQALAEIQKLSDPEQDAIATLILDELVDEHRWDVVFANSQDKLSELAAKVRGDILAGRVSDQGFDDL